MAEATRTAVPTRDQIAVEDTWDLSGIYPSDEAWDADAARVSAAIDTVVAYRGRLGEDADTASGGIAAVFDLQNLIMRLIVFANLRRDEDTTNTEANARYERAVTASIQAGEAIAFFQPELLSLDADVLRSYIEHPDLQTYRHVLEDLERNRAHVRSAEVEAVLAQYVDVSRAASEAFSALDNADLDFGEIEDEHGQSVQLSHARYGQFMERRDRPTRARAFAAMSNAYRSHQHTVASLHGSSVRKDVAAARVRGFESARGEALFADNIPDAVYDGLLAVVREHSTVIERTLNMRKRALRLDELYRYDLRVPLSPEPPRHYDYREAVEIVLDGAVMLGSRYVDDLREGFKSRWVDVHETKGKRSGAYSWGTYGAPPVMLMNWNGTMSDVFTLTHEAGHAMHSFYANAAQPFHLASYPIFLAEIASTVNEVLLTWHLLDSDIAADPLTRFSILNRFVEGFDGTVIRQSMFADFEQRTHAAAEAGQPLTLEFLNQTFREVSEIYSPGVVNDEDADIGWARIPHFYRAFYVYQYATGLSAAINIARSVRDDGDATRERYLALLAAGGSDYPLTLLQKAGVDLTSEDPIRVAFEEFETAVAEMERLVDSGVLDRGEPSA